MIFIDYRYSSAARALLDSSFFRNSSRATLIVYQFFNSRVSILKVRTLTKTFKMQPSEIQTTAEEKIRMVERQYEKYALDSNAEVAKNHENIDTWNRIENIVYKMMSKS